MHLLHAARRLVRHVDVDLRQRAERAAVAARQRHGAQPAAPAPRAALRSRWPTSPLVEIATATSPARPSASTCRAKIRVEAVVVGHARQHARVGRQRHRRHARPVPLEPPDQLRGEVLGVGGAATVAEHQHLRRRRDSVAAIRSAAADHRLQRFGAHPPVQRDRVVEHPLDRARGASLMPAASLACVTGSAPPPCWRRTPLPTPGAARRSSPRMLDLHRVVAPPRVAFPVLGHQDPPQVRMAVDARCRTCRTARARPSSPTARRPTPSAGARRRRPAPSSAAASAWCRTRWRPGRPAGRSPRSAASRGR